MNERKLFNQLKIINVLSWNANKRDLRIRIEGVIGTKKQKSEKRSFALEHARLMPSKNLQDKLL